MPAPPPMQHSAATVAAARGAHSTARVVSAIEQNRKPAAAPKPAAPRPPTAATATAATSSKARPELLPAPLAARLEGGHTIPLTLVLASSLLMQTAVDADFEKTGAFSSAAAGAAEAAEAAATAAASPSPSPCSSFLLPGTPPALTGAALGLFCACALISLAKKTARATPSPPLRVVVTGGSKGLGKALAREHLLSGDSVVVAARDWGRLMKSARELSEDTGAELVLLADDDGGEGEEGEDEEAEEGNSDGGGLSSPRPTITPIACDVSDRASVARLVSDSLRAFGKKGKETGNGKRTIDCFYSNAGDSGGFRKFLDSDPESLARVVSTNLLGTVLCSRAAMEAMVKEQHEGPSSPSFGHIFLVEGAGSDGLATPGYAAYGATKAATAQLVRSLAAEARALTPLLPPLSSSSSSSSSSSPSARGVVGFHALSPGLVLTPLLLDGLFPVSSQPNSPPSLETKMRALAFDALAEHPSTAAAFLVPRARALVAKNDRSSAVRYLTPTRAIVRLLSAPFLRGRHFDKETATPRWESEDRERRRLESAEERSAREQGARAAAARGGGGRGLALSFALSSAALFVMLVAK